MYIYMYRHTYNRKIYSLFSRQLFAECLKRLFDGKAFKMNYYQRYNLIISKEFKYLTLYSYL